MMFKFQLGKHERCAGCVLALPQSVWESWQRHLGSPPLTLEADGSFTLLAPGKERPDPVPAWIYIFDPDATAEQTPSPITVVMVIGTDVPAMSHWALEVAPLAALENIGGEAGMLFLMARRLRRLWPELAHTLTI
jgi:hypothetical protein